MSVLRSKTAVLTVVIVVVAVTLAYEIVRRYRDLYPYGRSHCCDIGLYFALANYAEQHNGHFPHGEATAEASLSLLARGDYGADADLLRGKTVPKQVVQSILDRGGLLGPDTCGWHYVEGLTQRDDSRLALFWSKAGLGHFGNRLPAGSHLVHFVGGDTQYVTGDKWDEFLAQQAELFAAREPAAKEARPWLQAQVRLPDGRLVVEYDAPYTISHSLVKASGSSSGEKLVPSVLRWWTAANLGAGGLRHGQVTMSLRLNGSDSRPVIIEIIDGQPTRDSFVFDLGPGP